MTTDVFPFFGTIQQLWGILCSEYDKLYKALGREPFFFEQPVHSVFREYTPKDGDEIYIEFREPGKRDDLITIEFEPKAGDAGQFTVFLHVHGNAFQEPHKSAVQIWKQIEESMRARGYLPDPKSAYQKPSLPPKPAPGSSLDGWFDWYHAALDAGFKVTLQEIARETQYAVGTTKQKHAAYAKARGQLRSKKTNQK